MKAAVLRGVGKPLAIEEVQIADPRSHEVLIRTAAVGVCHSDLHYMISRRIELEQINEAFEEMKRGDVARSVITFSSA